jgi:cytochrome c6
VKKLYWVLAGFLTLSVMAAAQAPEEKGAAAFKENCALCHADNGSGSDMGKALKVKDLRSKEVQDETNESLAKTVRDGKNNMPPFKSRLSDAQVDELIGYIRHLAQTPAQ